MQIYHARQGAQSPHESLALEQRINTELRRLIAATDRCDQLAAWQRMVALIGKRSPERIAEMERERWLVAS
jgi:hypothetical protein